MRAVLVHHSLDACGGAEFVAVATAELLNELGYDVDLVTIKKPNLDAIKKTFNSDMDVAGSHFILPASATYNHSMYYQLSLQLLTMPLLKQTKPTLVINTHADFPLPYFTRKSRLVNYVHFPHFPQFFSPNDYPIRYQRSALWKLYFGPYAAICNMIFPFLLYTLKRSLVLTNSQFSKNAIMQEGPELRPIVVRPPVDTSAFSDTINSTFREKKVLVVGRFVPEKHHEIAIEICKQLDSDIKMVFVGSYDYSIRSTKYLEKLNAMISTYELDDRIKLCPNVSRTDLKKHMMNASVYLHTKFDEHFGISIIEAISAGLIPVVPFSGGPKEFIPKAYQYRTSEEAAELITKNIDAQQNERLNVNRIANSFSKEKFKEKLQSVLCLH